MSYALILTSLLLGLLGTYTKTFADEERRKLTSWGKVVGVLLLLSAGLAAWDQFEDGKARKREDLAARNASEAMRKTLSQQRMITLAALGFGYQLSRPPLVMFTYPVSVDADDERYGTEYARLEQFPGFGTSLAGYKLSLDLNDQRSFSFAQGTLPEGEHAAGEGGLTYEPDPQPGEMNHIFLTRDYRTLDEVILDFRPDREVGELRLWRRGSAFQPAEIAALREWFSTKRGVFFVQADIRRPGANLVYAHLHLPLRIDSGTVSRNQLAFKITAGEPELTSYDHGP